jgi:hypothetical protein
MPVVKGLPERPKAKNFQTSAEYTKAMESYTDALENWIDIRAFQDGDDEQPEIKGKADFKIKFQKDAIPMLLNALFLVDEAGFKKFILEKFPHGVGLIE